MWLSILSPNCSFPCACLFRARAGKGNRNTRVSLPTYLPTYFPTYPPTATSSSHAHAYRHARTHTGTGILTAACTHARTPARYYPTTLLLCRICQPTANRPRSFPPCRARLRLQNQGADCIVSADSQSTLTTATLPLHKNPQQPSHRTPAEKPK